MALERRRSQSEEEAIVESTQMLNLKSEEVAEAAKERVTENYWPKLKQLIKEDPSVVNRLDLECPICYERMTITDEEHVFEPILGGLKVSHQAGILPCGHMFGASCVAKMLTSNHSQNKVSACPCCRLTLKYRLCIHTTPGIPMPVKWNQIEQMLKTIPEGGKMPPVCFDCALARALNNLTKMTEITVDTQEYPDMAGLGVGLYVEFDGAESHHIKRHKVDSSRWIKDFTEGQKIMGECCVSYANTLKRQFVNNWCEWNIRDIEFHLGVYRPDGPGGFQE
ncbi:Fc.00g107440.m01.CDS01 [Cosmosporella sp. VM-42]